MNEHEARARAAKASRLARVCEQMIEAAPTISAEDFKDTPAEVRRRVEQVAGTREASDETWAVVYAILRSKEQHPDPFEGLTS